MLPLKFKRSRSRDLFSFLFLLLFTFSASQQQQTGVRTLTNGTSTAAAIVNKKCQEYSIHRFPKKADGSPNSVCPKQPGIGLYVGETSAEEANPSDFPHMALIGLEYPSGIVWRCGGSLISEYFVLTAAAHCHERAKFVRLGTTGEYGKDRNWYSVENYEIAQLILHPNYVQGKSFDNIMLIKLAKKVEFSPSVSPVCLYTSPEIDKTFRYGVENGFGGWDSNADCLHLTVPEINLYDTAHKQKLEFVDIHKCDHLTYALNLALWQDNITWNVADVQLNLDNMICVEEDDFYHWLFDHGSPLQIQLDQCAWWQVGIHSINRPFLAHRLIFTKVSHYIDWIQGVVWPQG